MIFAVRRGRRFSSLTGLLGVFHLNVTMSVTIRRGVGVGYGRLVRGTIFDVFVLGTYRNSIERESTSLALTVHRGEPCQHVESMRPVDRDVHGVPLFDEDI